MKTKKVQWYLNLQTNVKILQVKEFVIIEETKQKFPYPTKENVLWLFWM